MKELKMLEEPQLEDGIVKGKFLFKDSEKISYHYNVKEFRMQKIVSNFEGEESEWNLQDSLLPYQKEIIMNIFATMCVWGFR